MKNVFFLFTFLAFLMSCEKQNENTIPKGDEFKQGIPIGSPYIKEIDAKGGQIDIDLNEAKVVFPKNLFSKRTTVSVQPITNTLSNFGLGIRLASEFKNVKVTLRYPLNGMPPQSFEIYFMLSGSPWVKSNNKFIDTLNHTISILQNPDLQQTSKNKIQKNSLKVGTHTYDYVIGKSTQ